MSEARLARTPQAIDVSALVRGEVLVCDGFLSALQVEALRASARARQSRGEFRPGRIGAPHELERRSELRGDSICWLEPPLGRAEDAVRKRLEALRLELNREGLPGLFELELHYACYPPGARYARHLDQPRGRSERRVSMVLYLNPDWSAADGGLLRMHGAEGPRDIEPRAGRLVLFSSSDCEHEVLTTSRERLSLTGWFRARSAPYAR
ncbi:MAG TPA: 2OG-Fe(II) oxygenase [Steroidobacteraceae bacterium]|nr:2OG-Fe(II) oxygenase [Steroidobacteraceae bacterium]